LWAAARPNAQTLDFENKADSLRSEAVEELIYDLDVPSHRSRLDALRLAPSDLERLRRELDLFHYLNPKLLLQCALLKRSLGWMGYRGSGQPPALIEPGIAPRMPREMVLVELESAPHETRELLEEMRNRLNAPLLPVEYRALAKWPEYLRLAWQDLRVYHAADYYETHQEHLRQYALALVSGLPFCTRITAELARRRGLERGKLVEMVEYFLDILPPLILNISFLKIALAGGDEARKSPFPVLTVVKN
jgi:hypothetical protein